MARQKQSTPVRREVSSEYISKADRPQRRDASAANGHADGNSAAKPMTTTKNQAGAIQLIIAVGGIYASFLTWAVLQERLTTTPHGPPSSPSKFTYPIFLNTIQSLFAAMTGYIYLLSSSSSATRKAVFPTPSILPPLLLIALTASLASPFGYASLAHIDYITFTLAKSCKLLPVMFLHVVLFRRRYPVFKYLVVLSVTLGVSIFTLQSSHKKKSQHSDGADRNQLWGIMLLTVNLLFDGLTNTTQDWVFERWSYGGPQMMVACNVLSTAVMGTWLALGPTVARSGVAQWLGMEIAETGEVGEALAFLAKYPTVWWDVLGFAACGAVGQVFIFYTLSTFSSVLLVTVTVTRKMATMMLSVVMFGHRLSSMQWLGVALVFGGVGAEAGVKIRGKKAKGTKKE